MTLGKFLQDAAQFNIYRRLDVKEQIFLLLCFGELNFQEHR